MSELVPLIREKNFKPRPQNRILVPLGGSQRVKVFRGAPPSFLRAPPHSGGPRRHLHSLCKTSDSDILDTAADCHATLISGIG